MNFDLHHGLKNSVSGILSASESLLDDLPEAQGDNRILIQAIQHSCESILRLLDDELARASCQVVNLTYSAKTELDELIQNVVKPASMVSRVKIRASAKTGPIAMSVQDRGAGGQLRRPNRSRRVLEPISKS